MENKTMRNFFGNLLTEQEARDRIERRDDLKELFESWSAWQSCSGLFHSL